MTDGRTADARLERLMHVLPAASRDGGAALTELAAALDASEKSILEDLEEVTTRVFYHPGGWPDDLQILLEPDRVRVLHAQGLTRPARLTSRETLCLALALRGTVASSHIGDPEVRAELLRRAEEHLVRREEEAGGKRAKQSSAADLDGSFAAPDHEPDEGEHRETLLRAARERTPCAILYLKSGAEDAEARVIHPYALVQAEGAWYTVAHCCVREAVRLFRVDRVLEAAPADDTFDVPDDFDLTEYAENGRLYRAGEELQVRIRYSSRIARWIRERARYGVVSLGEEPDGSIVVDHGVADPSWALQQVLQYGADAEIVEPEELRGWVRAAAERMAG